MLMASPPPVGRFPLAQAATVRRGGDREAAKRPARECLYAGRQDAWAGGRGVTAR